MLDELAKTHPELIEGCETFEADKGYDDTKLYVKPWISMELGP
jgi:hypothetical protein